MDASVSSKIVLTDAMEDKLRSIVGAESVRAGRADEAIAGVPPRIVAEPVNEQEVAAVLRWANENDIAVIPRGGGTKLSWGNPPRRAELILSTLRLNKIREHAWADLTVSVEAGCTIQVLQDCLAQHGQRLALDALWPERATVGGVLSTNDSGGLRLRFGSLRDLIIGVTLALPDGTLASSGGKVVKNVAGYDLQKLTTGALGTLGVITRAIFRLHPLPKFTRTFSCVARDSAEIQRLMLSIQNSKLAHAALQVRFVPGAAPELDVLFEATEAGLDAQSSQLRLLVSPTKLSDAGVSVWRARQKLYSAGHGEGMPFVLAKISVLSGDIKEVIETTAGLASTLSGCRVVMQATGVGNVWLQGEAARLASTVESFRAGIERGGGSFVIHDSSINVEGRDAWGAVGDALPLMRAVKQQFDPKGTLNPGRFVGGI